MDRFSRLSRRTTTNKTEREAAAATDQSGQPLADRDLADLVAEARIDTIGTSRRDTGAGQRTEPTEFIDPIAEQVDGPEEEPTEGPQDPSAGPGGATGSDDAPGDLLDRALEARTPRDPTAFDDPRAALRQEAAGALSDLAGRASQGLDPLTRDGSLVSDAEAERTKHGNFTVPNAHTVTTPGVGFSATEGVVVGE
ncbi:MAG TPA: hypothetical protein VK866_05015, partial [Acidimicrobiales bacterium]|nr:hypothetical protein [Acidimicrobiales bacterium]